MSVIMSTAATCTECGFTTRDVALLKNHSCDVQSFGGRCEDYPCCGHEAGDCNGLLYGSDEAIREQVYRDIRDGHGDCDHQDGVYNCDVYDEEDEDEDE
jgi:hypothetical protein